VKWRSSEGKLVLKITDDVTVRIGPFTLRKGAVVLTTPNEHACRPPTKQCLKFKTHSSIFLGRFEALNRSLIQKMTNSRPVPPAAEQVAPATPQAQVTTTLPSGSKSGSTPTASTGGGVKKKKGKKK
jgi:signal recognition particle subunit SRP9